MAVFPDRIVLKNSADTEAEVIAAIETGGTDEITQGELVLGLTVGGTKLYTKDANGDIVSLGGIGTGPQYIDDLLDVDTSTISPVIDQTLVWNGTNWVPGDGGSSDVVDLDDLGDVVAPNPSTGQILEWNGSNWVSADPSGGGGTGGLVFWGGGDFTTGVSDGEPADGGEFTV